MNERELELEVEESCQVFTDEEFKWLGIVLMGVVVALFSVLAFA